jgi:hypothetical protein
MAASGGEAKTEAASAHDSTRASAQPSPQQLPPPEQQQLLLINVSCRNLSSNGSVVALLEAKEALVPARDGDSKKQDGVARVLEYVCHTEGLRQTHHPDFTTPLRIVHHPGAGQKVKFNGTSFRKLGGWGHCCPSTRGGWHMQAPCLVS